MVRSLFLAFSVSLLAACGGNVTNPPLAADSLHDAAAARFAAPQAGATPWASAYDARIAHAQANCTTYPSEAENLLTDGDFTGAAFPTGNVITTVSAGGTLAPDWTVTSGSVDLYSSPYFRGPDGTCSVDMDGSPGPGTIVHSNFDTVIGDQYTVSFLLSGNGECGGNPAIKHLTVMALNASQKYTYDISGGQNAAKGDFVRESFSFIAKRNRSNLKFISTDAQGNCGAVIAAVSVART